MLRALGFIAIYVSCILMFFHQLSLQLGPPPIDGCASGGGRLIHASFSNHDGWPEVNAASASHLPPTPSPMETIK